MTDSERPHRRRPAAFSVDPDPNPVAAVEPRAPQVVDDAVLLTPDADDPFAETTVDGPPLAATIVPRQRRFVFARIAIGALGLLVSLALGLWIDGLVRDLFARADWLGYLALAAVIAAGLSLVAIIIREVRGILQLNTTQALRRQTAEALALATPAPARAVLERLSDQLATKAQTARGRARLKETEGEIIDGPQLLDLAERELLGPLDREARGLILSAAKRVSIVTAVSPRALVDLGYVVYEASRTVRAMAELYGSRPGTLGMMRLMRDVIAHLAVTGSIAAGDSLIQQIVGHGIVSKLSARLGEGVVNGLMTARIGIAAMDLCRPMPFSALKRPGIGDFIGDLTPGSTTADRTG